MDKEVLIRFVQFLETVFGRINSKRLLVLAMYLVFLAYSKEVTELAVYFGTLVTLVCLWMVWRQPANNDTLGSGGAGDAVKVSA